MLKGMPPIASIHLLEAQKKEIVSCPAAPFHGTDALPRQEVERNRSNLAAHSRLFGASCDRRLMGLCRWSIRWGLYSFEKCPLGHSQQRWSCITRYPFSRSGI